MALVVVVFVMAYYQVSLQRTYKGNLSVHLFYHPLTEKCIDFSLLVNGERVMNFDSIGYCSNNFSLDTTLNLPLGINTITYHSDSINYNHSEKVINLLFMWNKIELYQYVDPFSQDSVQLHDEIGFHFRPAGFI